MPYDSVSDAEKTQPGLRKYSDKAKRGWLSAFNSCMERDGEEGKCFAIAYSVANKVDGKKGAGVSGQPAHLRAVAEAVAQEWAKRTANRRRVALSTGEIEDMTYDPLYQAVMQARNLREIELALKALRSKYGKEALDILRRAVERFGGPRLRRMFQEVSMFVGTKRAAPNSLVQAVNAAYQVFLRRRPDVLDDRHRRQQVKELWAPLVEWAKRADAIDVTNLWNASDKTALSNTLTLAREIKMKHGPPFPEGTRLTVKEWLQDRFVRLEAEDHRTLSLPIAVAWRYLRGFPKPPGMATLEKWSNDSVAKAVDGARVEPDGHSPSGAPSWLLVLGVI